MTAIDWKRELIEQLDFAWNHHFLHRMEGLTDEEYLWEPVADVWNVRPGTNGGEPTVELEWDADPAPFTTIAWRMQHMADFFTKRRVNHFGDPESETMSSPVSLTAEGGMANLKIAYDRWKHELETMSVEKLGQTCGEAEKYYPDSPFVSLVLHINREFIHHASECCLIRDLYRQRESLTPASERVW